MYTCVARTFSSSRSHAITCSWPCRCLWLCGGLRTDCCTSPLQRSYQLHRHRYASIQNLDDWTNGTLSYSVRANCAPVPACPAPVLAPVTGAPLACSGNGACGAGGVCACVPGWGDLGCDKRVMPVTPGARMCLPCRKSALSGHMGISHSHDGKGRADRRSSLIGETSAA